MATLISLWVMVPLEMRAQTSTGLSLEVLFEPGNGNAFEDGYIIASPRFSSNLTFPIIVSSTGVPLHNELNPYRGFNFDLHPDGRLAWYWTQGGLWEILDSSIKVVETLDFIGADPDYHDMELLGGGKALLLGQEIVVVDVADSVPDPSAPNRAIIDCLLQEVDSAGNVTWFWRASDHIPPIWCTHCNWNSSLIDPYHHNAFQTLDNGDILLCLRNMDLVVRINKITGLPVWACGGPFSDFSFTAPGTEFKHPHDAQIVDGNHLLLFDNGTDKVPLVTRGVEYALDLENGTATQVAEWIHPDSNYASSQGSIQRLEGGGTLIGWGTGSSDQFGGGIITEYDADGNMLGGIYFPSNHFSYRARKVPLGALPLIQGCRNETACDFNPDAALNGPCTFPGTPCDDGNPCTVADMLDSDCNCTGMGPSLDTPIGCSDSAAVNFDSCALPDVDDGSCQYAVSFRVDATMLDSLPDAMEIQFASNAVQMNPGGFGTWTGGLVVPNGDWTYQFVVDGVLDTVVRSLTLTWPVGGPVGEQRSCFGLEGSSCPGCTDPDDAAFSPFSEDDSRCGGGSWSGCTIEAAENYDPAAFFDDGTCTFGSEDSCPMDLDDDGIVGIADVLQLLTYFGLFCE